MRVTRTIPNATAKAVAALLEPYVADITPAAVRSAFGPVQGPRPAPRWATVHEAACHWVAPPRTVRYWAATGRVPAKRHGSQWLVDVSREPAGGTRS